MDSWAKEGVDLHLERTGGTGLRAGLEHALRSAVRGGRLEAGTRLPSSRQLAADLGVARNTVADAYTQLVAEGYLTGRRGAGTTNAMTVAASPASTERCTAAGTALSRNSRSDPEISRRPILGLMIDKYPGQAGTTRRRCHDQV